MNKLIEIQNELKVPKGNLNKFGNYKYRSAEDILEAVKPILLKHKGFLLLSDRVNQVGEKLFLQATASLYFEGKQIEGLPLVYESQGYAELSEHKGMSAEQTTGTASSYARKYALNGLFLIDETEQDADNDNKKEPVKEVAKTLPSTTATELPPLDDTNYKKVIELIKKKEFARVKKAIEIHSLLVEQKNDLIDYLAGLGQSDLLILLQNK